MLLTGALLVLTTNSIFLKKIVPTLIFELEIKLKPKVDEIGLLPRNLYGYNLVSILTPATPLKLPGRWN